MANLKVSDEFINYCNGINCNAQEKLNEIIQNSISSKKEEKPPLESPKEETKTYDDTDLNKLIELGTA
jgi:hypothetical protein